MELEAIGDIIDRQQMKEGDGLSTKNRVGNAHPNTTQKLTGF
jgi:hypothetical protein